MAVVFVPDRETDFNRDGTVHCERDPDDPGGTTMYGIDAGSHPGVDVPSLSEVQADASYYGTEWTKIQGKPLPPFLALPMLDTAVNPGIVPAGKFLQTALGFSGEAVDGKIGNATLTALAVQGQREAYYRARPAYRNGHPFGVRFLPGWLSRVNLTRAAVIEAARNLEIS